ncbi:MAG: tetratricopeptide repeat protein [Steroidobacteraceae bacterium]
MTPSSVLRRLRERGVLRVAASYAVIAWLLLQIASVVLDPLGVPKWVLTALIIAAAVGFPLATALAWFLTAGRRGAERDDAVDVVPRPTARGLRHYADAIVIAALLVAVAVLAVRQSDLGKPRPPENPAIAVLPFENVGGDPKQEYFSDGLAEETLDRLGRVPGLRVIARSSSFSFKGKDVDLKVIGERLGATTLLVGSVRRGGDRLRLSAQLVDSASGQEVWSGSYEVATRDMLNVQEQLVRGVAEAVIPGASGRMPAAAPTPVTDMSAYDLYLLGRQAQEARWGNRVRESAEYLEQAVAKDPTLAKAHAALSRALLLWMFYDFEPAPADAEQRAEAEAHRALALDPMSSEAHAAMGTVLRNTGNAAGAEREYRRALEINPNNAVALWDYALLLDNDLKQERNAQVMRDRLSRIDPRSAALWRYRVEAAARGPDAARQVPGQVRAAIEVLADDVDALRLVQVAARSYGYAPEAYRASLAIRRAGDEQTATLTIVRTWLLVDDFERASDAAARLERFGNDELKSVGAYMAGEIAGLQGRFAATREYFKDSSATHPWNAGAIARSQAFWHAVQGRYSEANELLPKLDSLPEYAVGGLGASLIGGGQLLPAVLRTYRATGRAQEADALAARYLDVLRRSARSDVTDGGLDLAALAANEGLKDEAVATLGRLFERLPLVEWFHPESPWFKTLEGYAPYDRLMTERSRRIGSARAAMLRMDANASPTAGQDAQM